MRALRPAACSIAGRSRRPAAVGGLIAGLLLSFGAVLPASAPAAPKPATPTPLNPPLLTIATGDPAGDLVVQPDGTAVIAWHGPGALDQSPVYDCRLPPTATACGPTIATQVPSYTLAPVYPIIPDPSSPNDLYLFTGRSDSSYALHSSDGGATFATPLQLGSLDSVMFDDATLGPAFSISAVTRDEQFEADPLDGSGAATDQPVDLGSPGVFNWSSAVGMVDPTTPLVASLEERPLNSGHNALVFRRWTDTGSVDDVSTWTAEQVVDVGSGEPAAGVPLRLLSGPKGLFAFFGQDAAGGGQRFVVARYDPVAGTFDAPVPVAPPAYDDQGAYSLATATEDAAGTIHVFWRAATNVVSPGAPHGFYYTVSVDGGKTFEHPTLLYDETNYPGQIGYGPRIAANATGDALLAFGTDGVYAIRLPRISGGSACRSTVSFGPLQALATSGCFTAHGTRNSTTGAVRIDGIDMQPPAGGGRLTIDTGAHTVTTTGSWSLRAGVVSLGTEELHWQVPLGGGQLTDTSTGGPVLLDAGAGGQRVLGMAVSGSVMPRFVNGVAHLPVNLKLPSPIGGFLGGPPTTDVDLTADNVGSIHLNKNQLNIELPEVSLGLASIKPFKITYTSDPFVFQGQLGIDLPLISGRIDSSWLFRNGSFVSATANYTPGPPAFPQGIPVAGFVFLTRVGLNVHGGHGCNDQTSLNINGDLTAGPHIGGASLLELDNAGATYYLSDQSCNEPARFVISGTGRIVGIDALKLNLTYTTPAKVTFAASGQLGGSGAGLFLRVDGGIDVSSGAFYASGSADVSLGGFHPATMGVTFGSVGFGGCASVSPLPLFFISKAISVGFEYLWQGGLNVMIGDCSVDNLQPAEFIGGGARAVAGPAGGPQPVAQFTVPSGGGGETVVATGTSTPPQLTLEGPDGEVVSGPAPNQLLDDAAAVGMQLPSLNETSITLKAPAAGQWTVLNAGSDPVAGVRFGHEVPPVSVHAQVRQLGGTRFALDYRAGSIPGQTIRFFQVGQRTEQLIGVARDARGTIVFAAGPGVAERRRVVAVVEQSGIARAAPIVARFSAPDTLSVKQPQDVRLTRTRGGLRVSWQPVPGAARYIVRIILKDGRRPLLVTAANKHAVFLGDVPGIDPGRVLVAAQSLDGHLGPAAPARLRTRPLRPAKHRTRGKGRVRRPGRSHPR